MKTIARHDLAAYNYLPMGGISNSQILGEIRTLAGITTGIARQVDRLEQRMADVEARISKIELQFTKVEEQVSLIPGLVEALTAFSDDIDSHEKRLRKLESLRA